MGFAGRIRCALCCCECESLRELIWADILWHSTLIFANIFFICLTTFLTLSLSLSLCLSFSQLGQGLQWSNINEDGFVVYVDRWEKFKRIKNSICQQVDEGKWATGWLVSLATWGDTLSASRRVRERSRRWQLFIINCAAKWRRLYDKNHYNKFSACLIVKQEKSSSQSAPFPRFPFPFFTLSLLFQLFRAAYHGIYFGPLSKSDAAFGSTRSKLKTKCWFMLEIVHAVGLRLKLPSSQSPSKVALKCCRRKRNYP